MNVCERERDELGNVCVRESQLVHVCERVYKRERERERERISECCV